MVDFLMDLASLESPSHRPETQVPVQALLTEALEELGFDVRVSPGRRTGGVLRANLSSWEPGAPYQLLLGHCDTVWDVTTLETMPLVREGNRLKGPGVFDMKGGLTQMVFALRILRELGLEPALAPSILVNADEEIGSPESKPAIEEAAQGAARAFVPEPGMGLDGRVKTARKGWGRFDITVEGKAAHAGLDPTGGISAILEMAHQIQRLHAMTDLERGLTVNVGVISGGTRSNVIPAEARCEVDVRVLAMDDGREVEERIRSLSPIAPGARILVEGGFTVPPLERTPRNRALWEAAREAAADLGVELEEDIAGGGSDGNTTSQFTATLDGIGPVGDGAHAPHEFLFVDKLVERTALLARLLLLPA
jgi:glutamate carboxypeptidase